MGRGMVMLIPPFPAAVCLSAPQSIPIFLYMDENVRRCGGYIHDANIGPRRQKKSLKQ